MMGIVSRLIFSRIRHSIAFEVASVLTVHLAKAEMVDDVGGSLQNNESLLGVLALVRLRRRYLAMHIKLVRSA